MKNLHKHHPARLAIGLLLLGLASSALTGMVIGSTTSWLARAIANGLQPITGDHAVRPSGFYKAVDSAGELREWHIERTWAGAIAQNYEGVFAAVSVEYIDTLPSLPWDYVLPRLDPHDSGRLCVLSGWPFAAISWDSDFGAMTGARMGVTLDKQGHYVIPLRPNWPGLLANVPIHAAMWGVLLVLPTAVRTYLRRKRGRCLTCGYDANGLETCPECGGELAAQ